MPENLRSVAEPLLAALPIASLVWMMTKKNSLPAWQALPLSAALLYAIKLLCFQNSVWQLNAAALSGVLYAFTPLLIAFGAILLFLTMEATGCMNAIRIWLSGISDDRTAELMLIGWAFVFLIEGASGFGTPAALAAPLLVGLGFKPVKTAVFCLMANSISVPFGAVGVPTWFGLSAAGLDKAQMLQVSFDSALIQFVAALFVIPLAVGLTLGFDDVKRKFVFIILSTLSCTLPFLVLARFNYEFPSLLGGGIGLLATCYLARRKIGLGKELAEDETSAPPQRCPCGRHWRSFRFGAAWRCCC